MATTLNITDNFTELVSKFNELSAGVGTITGLDIEGESDLANIITSIYALIDSDTDFRSKISVTDAGGDGSLSYSSSTGVITYTGPSASESRAHFQALDLGGDGSFAYDSSTGNFSYTGPSASEVRAHISVTDAGGDGSLSYNSGTGVITYTGPSASEVRAHFSATGDLSYNSSTGEFSFSDSAQRTDSEIRGLISVTDAGGDGSLSYNSSTGAITYTGPSAGEVRAHFSAGDGIAISSGSIALETPTRFRLFDSTGATLLDLYGAGSL